MKRTSIGAALLVALSAAPGLRAQQVPVSEYVLPNGLKLLMVPRKGTPNVAAGWVAKVGSVNERPGITGISHLFEHMMFKGTRAIGTRNIAEDLRLMERMDAVKAELRREEQEQVRRLRLGEITDLKDPKERSVRQRELLEELQKLEKAQKDLLVPNEFDKIYTAAGASGMNAGTDNDYTLYFINVPSNKLELWFWMESDRLLEPVFREFYAERDVVYEERRMRIESTPTGKYDEEFEALFWTSSPYGWPVIGWPSDLDGITREEALAYFAQNYAPNNVAACLVGDFDPARARELADRYFSRLRRSPVEPQPVRTREVAQLAEKRMVAFAETNPEVRVRYHTVADGHRDEPALVLLGAILSGRTGRLTRSLVLDQKIANGASAGQNGLKYDGYFFLGGVARPGSSPEQVETALYREIEKIQKEEIPDRELQKVKNRESAANFRRLQSGFELMLRLLLAESGRGWPSFNEDPKRIEAVTAEDIRRVATTYFKPENRAVALFYTRRDANAAEDPQLAGLSEPERARVRQFRARLAALPEDQARAMLERLAAEQGAAPPEQRKVLEVFKKLLEQKLAKGAK
jgi:predicted Zn-dependent peptidase